jgi:hypothetical protein
MALSPNDTLFNGQYCTLCQLGRGGFGFVYLAHDTLPDEQAWASLSTTIVSSGCSPTSRCACVVGPDMHPSL